MKKQLRKSYYFLFALWLLSHVVSGQAGKQQSMTKVEPPFWFVGMKIKQLQILFYHQSVAIRQYTPTLNYEGVKIVSTETVDNSHYLFLNLEIADNAKPGKIKIQLTKDKSNITIDYELRGRSLDMTRAQGFNSSDVVYLIMPDRFANGDKKNDSIAGFYQGTHREQPFGRHGGDIKGITDHLDYIQDLGVTALWLNPVLENNQKRESYHGYAITDLYQVDRRFGTNEEYLAMINQSHRLGLKVIQDMVMNHIGNEHWLVKDLPAKDWIHQFPKYTSSNYRGILISDPYQAKPDVQIMSDGWFDTTMPDVNQQNPLFARYLIQNSIWWIEYAGIDGIRMDTYPYPDKEFMARWCSEVLQEFPRFNIVGEAWLPSVTATAYWQKGTINKDGYQSTLPSVTDFPLCFTIPRALNESGGWDSGLVRLFDMLNQDIAYPNPNHNLTFLDNHDVTRFYRTIGNDLDKFKMALGFLLTTRGIPQLYYGTELLMDGDAVSHPNVRRDYPGGWALDQIDAFKNIGLTKEQIEARDFLKKLLKWRKGKRVIHTGKLTHYLPKDNVYVYFKTNETEKVMVILNASGKPYKIDINRFSEFLRDASKLRDVLHDEDINDIVNFEVSAGKTGVFEIF